MVGHDFHTNEKLLKTSWQKIILPGRDIQQCMNKQATPEAALGSSFLNQL